MHGTSRRRTSLTAAALALCTLCLVGSPAHAQDTEDDTRSDLDGAIADTVERTEAPEILVIGRQIRTGVPEVPLRAVGSRDVFGPDRVRETGARDLNDLVVNIPAISTRPYNGGEAAAPSFSMRGLPDDGLTEYIHVLIDGVPASPLPYGWTAFSFLPITTERVYAVDFIRGAHSVRYSPNTVGGVLNFITRPIPDSPRFELRNTIGSDDYRSTLMSVGTTDGPLGVMATVVTRTGDGYRDGGDFDQEDLNLKLRYDVSDRTWVATSISYMDSEHEAPGGLTLAEFKADRFGNSRPRNHFSGDRWVVDALLHHDHDDGWFEAFGYYSETYRNLIAQRPHFGRATSILDWSDTGEVLGLGGRATHELELGGMGHKIHYGGRFHRERLPHWKITSAPFAGGPSTLTRDSGFGLDTWSLHVDDTVAVTDELTVTAGVRWENVDDAFAEDSLLGIDYEDDYDEFLPGAGASYAFNEQVALFGNVFEGFRAPQVWGFGSSNPAGDLDFEESSSTELGIRVRDVAGFTGAVTRWKTEFDDVAVFYSGFYENLGDIESDGTDVELELDVGEHIEGLQGLTIGGSVTYQDSELKAGPNAGNESPYAWERKAAWSIRYETDDEWVFVLGGTYVGDSYSDELNTVPESADGTLGRNPSRTLWDVRVSKRFHVNDRARIDVAVGATNVFDEDWFVHSRGGFFGGGKVAGPPRQTYLSVGLELDW